MAVPYPDESQVGYEYEPQFSWPAFQPAPTRTQSQYAPTIGKQIRDNPAPMKPIQSNTVAWFNLAVGTIMLSLMILIPVWASGRLLWDQIVVFFIGRNIPFCVIVSCVSVVVGYILVLLLLVWCGKREEATSQPTFLSLFMVFVTLLGLMLLLFSIPLRAQCDRTFQDLTLTCRNGGSTAQLYSYYHALLALRTKPDCLNKESVEFCEGYEASQPYTGFLKFLEQVHLCSGFCYDSSHPFLANTTGAAKRSNTSLLQTGPEDMASLFQAKARVSKRNKLANMLHSLAQEEVGMASEQGGSSKALQRRMAHKATAASHQDAKYEPVSSVEYPPTLFNSANYQASCDGQASRNIRYKALDIAENQYLAGVFLLVGAIVAGVLRLYEMCSQMKSRPDKLRF